ncbi:hypothetical protein M3J09_007895 [Ascochyta lentis]
MRAPIRRLYDGHQHRVYLLLLSSHGSAPAPTRFSPLPSTTTTGLASPQLQSRWVRNEARILHLSAIYKSAQRICKL